MLGFMGIPLVCRYGDLKKEKIVPHAIHAVIEIKNEGNNLLIVARLIPKQFLLIIAEPRKNTESIALCACRFP